MTTCNRAASPVWPLLRMLALGATACTTLAWAGPNAVPFKASIASEERLGFDPVRCPLGGIVGTTTGSGQASHLGAVRLVAVDCPVFAPGTAPTFSDGVLTLTASNGDTLTASYQGALHPLPGVPDGYTITGVFSVTGGTGRFADARGSGELGGTLTLGRLVSRGEFRATGQLSY